jgi:hypothetical protein
MKVARITIRGPVSLLIIAFCTRQLPRPIAFREGTASWLES